MRVRAQRRAVWPSDVISNLVDGGRKFRVHQGIRRLEERAAGNSYQVKSFEPALSDGVGFLVTKDFAKTTFGAVARHGVSKLA